MWCCFFCKAIFAAFLFGNAKLQNDTKWLLHICLPSAVWARTMWTTIMHEWRPSYSYLRNFQYRYGMTMREVPEQHISRGLWVSCGKIGKQSIETCWTRRWRMNDPCADHTLPPKICPACGFDMMWQGEAEVGWSRSGVKPENPWNLCHIMMINDDCMIVNNCRVFVSARRRQWKILLRCCLQLDNQGLAVAR